MRRLGVISRELLPHSDGARGDEQHIPRTAAAAAAAAAAGTAVAVAVAVAVAALSRVAADQPDEGWSQG